MNNANGDLSDDENNNDQDDAVGTAKTQPFYEQLGAPVLLYRNRETYTALEEDASLCNAVLEPSRTKEPVGEAAATLFATNQSQLYRAQTRWYYPADYHVLSSVLPEAHPSVKEFYGEWRRKKQPPVDGEKEPRAAATTK